LGLRRAKLRLSNNARALANVTNNLASSPAVVLKGEGGKEAEAAFARTINKQTNRR